MTRAFVQEEIWVELLFRLLTPFSDYKPSELETQVSDFQVAEVDAVFTKWLNVLRFVRTLSNHYLCKLVCFSLRYYVVVRGSQGKLYVAKRP